MTPFRPTAVAQAAALAFALGACGSAGAQSVSDLVKEIQALKARVAELEAKQKAAPAAPAGQWGMTPEQKADFNRIAVKTEALEDNMETQGFKGLKITGVIDPTFIYNKNQRTSSFEFLNNFTGSAGNDVFAYDNSYFGMAVIDFQKELEGGTRWHLTIAPHKSTGSNYNFPSIVHEASVSIPMGDLSTRLWAGQIPDWSGYEYYLANQNKFVTHNLLFDFLAPTFYTGVGTEMTRGKWIIKTMLGNMNTARNLASGSNGPLRDPVFSMRVDYSKGEFSGWGSAIQIGRTTNNVLGGNSRLINGEVDGYFTRGDLTLQGQFSLGQQRKAALNGEDARWMGLSGLGAYKVSPRFEVAARLDYIKNDKNGGGTFNLLPEVDTNGNLTGFVDTRNGFGPGAVFDDQTGLWGPGDINKGSNRWALSLAFNYTLTGNTMLKAEYRYDRSNQRVFFVTEDGSYRRDNHLFGTSVVVSF